jgi:hypothetical protein
MQTNWELYCLSGKTRTALKEFGYNDPGQLAKSNRIIYARIRRHAVRVYYQRFKKYAGPLRLKAMRRILARVFDLSLEHVNSICYRKGGKE